MNMDRVVGSGDQQIQLSDIMIQADTTLGATNLLLPKIPTMQEYKRRTGNELQPVEFFFKNTGGVNPLTVTAADGDLVNNQPQVVLTGAFSNGYVTIDSDHNWVLTVAFSNGTIGKYIVTTDVPPSPPTPTIPLGEAATYVILTGGALTNGVASQLVTGNVGQVGAPSQPYTFVSGADFPAPISSQAVADSATAYAAIVAKTATFTFPSGAVNIGTVDTGNGAGIFKAGTYKGDGAFNTSASGVVTFDGDGDYIFYFNGAGTTGANTIFVLKNGAKPSRIFFAASAALTTGDATVWRGTFISPAGFSIGTNVNMEGRVISSAGAAGTTGGGANSFFLPTS